MIYEKRNVNGDRVDTIKIEQKPDPEILNQYPGYVVFESFLVLYKPRIPAEEAGDMKQALELLGVKKTDTWTGAVNPIVRQF